jgi:hypothetical protein
MVKVENSVEDQIVTTDRFATGDRIIREEEHIVRTFR